MATNYESLKTELQTLANQLTNSVAKYQCLALIDQYVAAFEAQASSTANDVSSYSIGGRSVTRSSSAQFQSQTNRLLGEINELLYGNVTLGKFVQEEDVAIDADTMDGS